MHLASHLICKTTNYASDFIGFCPRAQGKWADPGFERRPVRIHGLCTSPTPHTDSPTDFLYMATWPGGAGLPTPDEHTPPTTGPTSRKLVLVWPNLSHQVGFLFFFFFLALSHVLEKYFESIATI